jgi:hypothetical protein
MMDKIQRFKSVFGPGPDGSRARQYVAQEDEDPLTEVANMSIQEIREYLPLAQKDLEAIESDLEQLMEQKDATIILIAAMYAKLDALTEMSRRDGDPLGLSRVRGRD